MRRVLAVMVAVLFLTATNASGQSPCVTPVPTATFGDGIWMVGVDIEPGTYRSSGGDMLCMWARLSGFSGDAAEDWIANGSSTGGPQIATIEPTDAGFDTSGCGTWSLIA